jgi:hypothetical protein
MSTKWKMNQLVTHGNKPTGYVGSEQTNEVEPLLTPDVNSEQTKKQSSNGVEPLLPTELNANQKNE